MGSRAYGEVSLFKISSNSRLKSGSNGNPEDREKKIQKSFVLEAQKLKRDFTPPEKEQKGKSREKETEIREERKRH